MGTDTYSNPDVVARCTARYINVQLQMSQSGGIARKYGAPGTPWSVMLGPDGELMGTLIGRRTYASSGYLSAHDLLDTMDRVEREYPKLAPLLKRFETDKENVLLAKEIADTCATLNLIAKEREWYRRVADIVSAKEAPSDDERRACALSYDVLFDLIYNWGNRGRTELDELLGLVKKAHDMDAENRFDTLDNVLAWNAATLYLANDLDAAAQAAWSAYNRFPKGDRVDMVLYVAGMSEIRTNRFEDARRTLGWVASNYAHSVWGDKAQQTLDELARREKR